jgi:biopolymer transport protein ExbB
MNRLLEQALETWSAGGWAMGPLAVNSLILFVIGFNLWLTFSARSFERLPEAAWRRWIAAPRERRGRLGRLLDFVMGAPDLKEMGVRFNELRTTEIAPFARDLRFMKICVGTAPLLGLLGTVTGMLTTFHALASGSGGQKTMDLVAGGISEALITTETGLVIALPGLFFQFHLAKQRDRHEAFLAHLETACAQHLYRQAREAGALADRVLEESVA